MNKEIDQIIAAKINGTATDLQNEQLEEWRKDDPSNEETYRHITEFLDTKYSDIEIINEEEIRDQIWKKAGKHSSGKTRKLINSKWSKIAAAVLILIASSMLLFDLVNKENLQAEIQSVQLVEKETVPGVKSTIHLPDGTKVILNSSSKISYADKFTDSVRWVKLEGEAFFDVAKNPEKPFIVQSGDILTKAIGTSFNIKTKLKACDVSLVEGVVSVQPVHSKSSNNNILLNPGEYVSYSESEMLSSGNFDEKAVTGWKDGLLVFKSADFNTVIEQLENWYGVQISLIGQEPTWSLNGTYDNDNLEYILKVLSHSQKFEYEFSGNSIKITI